MLKPTYSHSDAITIAGMTSVGSLSQLLLEAPADQRVQQLVEQPVARREEHREQDADEHLPDEVGREDRSAGRSP